ncbi:MAG: PilW family protein [Woeseiaceae bacterium]|nr:PilW family protein [Woeseiaceae bacterium]
MCRPTNRQQGITLVELMVALAIGSFLMIGAVQIYNQSRQAFVINESIARVQETAQFAMDIIESDVRMASNWGRTSRALTIVGRSVDGNANPTSLDIPTDCGAAWVLNLSLPVDGVNNTYNLGCAADGTAMVNSDVLTVRRASIAESATPLVNGSLKIQSTRTQGEMFTGTTVPAALATADAQTHDLLVSSYYVTTSSDLIPGVPTLRRKTLQMDGGSLEVVDQEVAPGVENLQVQFGVDVDDDNSVDRYVNPSAASIYDPASVNYIAGARVITARIWLVVRGTTIEVGIEDNVDYEPGDRDLGVQNDSFRRMMVSKTILLRNARS